MIRSPEAIVAGFAGKDKRFAAARVQRLLTFSGVRRTKGGQNSRGRACGHGAFSCAAVLGAGRLLAQQ